MMHLKAEQIAALACGSCEHRNDAHQHTDAEKPTCAACALEGKTCAGFVLGPHRPAKPAPAA